MQQKFADKLRCPVSKEKLDLNVFEKTQRVYKGETREEIISAIFFSPNGFFYPVIDGVPRLQLESFLEYKEFCLKHVSSYDERKQKLMNEFGFIIKQSIRRNINTKKSFGFEWGLFKYNADTTWGWTKDARKERFLKEIGTTTENVKGKTLIDIGCGNGVLTSGISEFGIETVGLDATRSIERAFKFNENPDAHYVQGDLQMPPFARESFDIVYSTGVIHHTNNTELSFSCISELLKKEGTIYIWLYHPIKQFKHNAILFLRKFTKHLPLWLQYILYLVLFVPQAMIRHKLGGTKRTWREQLIDYFDVLSPEFRFEHTMEEVDTWLTKRNYSKGTKSIDTHYGFGAYAVKNA